MPVIRSISGLRATVDDCLTTQLVENYCRAFHVLMPEGPIVIGRDGRPSGIKIESTCADILVKSGREVRTAGLVPTPTVQLLTERSDAAGGIIVTASHNPSEWNGLKFIGPDGVFIDANQNNMLWDILDNNKFSDFTGEGKVNVISEPDKIHIDKVFELDVVLENIDKIKARKFKIVVDAVNASGSNIVPELLRRFNADVIPLFCNGTGQFPHTPEPLPENLTLLSEAVKSNQADLGIAVDPDADRLVLIDENGKAIGEELTIAISINSIFDYYSSHKSKSLKASVNLSTTRLVDDICSIYKAELYRSPVGEINVVNKMRQTGSIIGGEGSGGVILPEFHFGRDSLAGIALTLCLLSVKEKTLSQLCEDYPKYYILKRKFDYSGNINSIVDRIKSDFSDAGINDEDGIRIDFAKSWVQMRTSNTEPIIRIIAEAPEPDECRTLIDRFADYL